jgi:hypothetical protein
VVTRQLAHAPLYLDHVYRVDNRAGAYAAGTRRTIQNLRIDVPLAVLGRVQAVNARVITPIAPRPDGTHDGRFRLEVDERGVARRRGVSVRENIVPEMAPGDFIENDKIVRA